MTIVDLKGFRLASPFTPFYAKMADGSRHEIRHPEMIAVGNATCAVYTPGATPSPGSISD